MSHPVSRWAPCLAVFALAVAAHAATPPAGTVNESSSAQWSGGPGTPTAAAGCSGPSNPACDNFLLTIQPPAFAFDVEITLTPQTPVDDYDLEVYGPDGQLLGGSGSAPGAAEQVVLRNPAAGTYTVSASPYAAVTAYTAEARIVAQPAPPPPPPPPTEAPPGYMSYVPPQGVGAGAGEPTLGVNERTGAVMYIAGLETLKVDFNQCTSPATATWVDESFVTTSAVTFDPILFTDQPLGRTFVSQLLPSKISLLAFSDNDGTSWTPSQGAGVNAGVDHQSVGGGPFPAGSLLRPLTNYPNAVYYCSQDIAYANCAVSLDGGLTFGPAIPLYTLAECGGLHGHIKVGADGTAYVPNKNCGGEQGVAVSTDAGLTWAVRRVPGSRSGGSDPSAAVATDGTLYLGWADGSQHPYVAVSHDQGLTWSNITNVGTTAQGLPANIENVAFPAMVAGDGDRAAFAFLGSTTVGDGGADNPDFPAEWHLYIAHTYDGGLTWQTINVTPGDPVQRGTICQSGTTCGTTRNLLDFMDATIDADGRVLVGYADGCVGACKNGPPNSFAELATIARQTTGKRMYAAKDLAANSGPPATPLTSATWADGKVRLSWTQPEDHGSPITAYRVYRKRAAETAYTRLRQLYPDTFDYTDLYGHTGDSYYVTAVNARGESSVCGGIVPEEPAEEPAGQACVPPGRRVASDDSEDVPLAALDIQSLSIAEPSTPDGTHKLVFTLKVKDLQTITPGNAWMILWNRPRPDALYDRNYVVMRATGLGTADFKYGKLSPPNLNQATDLGNAVGSFGTDGTITITIDTAKADGVTAGQELAGLEVRVFALHQSGLPSGQATAVDYSPPASYTLAGNASCDNVAPVAANDSASTTAGTPVTVQVLANDADADGDRLQVIRLVAPAYGTAVSRKDGRLTYTPKAGFAGTDTFRYIVEDGQGHTATGKVTVTVRR